MPGKKIFALGICLALAAALSPAAVAEAAVEWRVFRSMDIEGVPLAIAATADGQSVFVLTDGAQVLIYSPDGTLKDRVTLDEPADEIAVSPRGEALILGNREKKTVQVILLDYVRAINTAGSPSKGPENAPVTIAVFTDFQ